MCLYLCHAVSSACQQRSLRLFFTVREHPSDRMGIVSAVPFSPKTPRGSFSSMGLATSCFLYSLGRSAGQRQCEEKSGATMEPSDVNARPCPLSEGMGRDPSTPGPWEQGSLGCVRGVSGVLCLAVPKGSDERAWQSSACEATQRVCV